VSEGFLQSVPFWKGPGLKFYHVNMYGIECFVFKQMLAETGKLDQVESQMGNKEFYIETKYDGERMQAHINGNNFK